MAEVTKENLIANDEFIWTYEVNGKTFRFRMPNENRNTINVEAAKPYVQSMKDLIESARSVRQQKLFGNIDIQGLAKSYSFEPFGYQIENVKTMLNRFEGNGVFGDQVGLGKTVQALMTAHAMFASGAIRNALIIVPTNTKAGWEKEITQKFAGVFNLIEPDSRTDFFGVLERIESEKKNNERENRVYIVTAEALKKSFNDISFAALKKSYNDAMSKELTAEEERVFNRILEKLKDEAKTSPIADILKCYGWAADSFYPLSKDGLDPDYMFFLYGMRPAKYKKLKNILGEFLGEDVKVKDDFERGYTWVTKRQKEIYGISDIIEAKLKEYGELQLTDNEKKQASLLDREERLIDLLIVDEIHSFFETENSKGETVRDEEGIRSAVEVLARINKKFCVLLSATPVRTRLENIFDLIYIANRAKLGANKKEALDYFYTTICQLPKGMDIEFALSTMMLDDNLSRNFFGMVNGFFTRKRIQDVQEQIYNEREYPKTFAAMSGLIGRVKDKLLAKRALMYRQKGLSQKRAEEEAENAYNNWSNNSEEWQKGKVSSRRHFYDALDAALMEEIWEEQNKASKNITDIKNLHRFVNWNRRKKEGIALRMDNSKWDGTRESLIDTVTKVLCISDQEPDELGSIYNEWDNTITNKKTQFLAKKIIGTFTEDPEKVVDKLNDFRNSLQHDSVAVYVSRDEIAHKDVRGAIVSAIEDTGRPISEGVESTEKNYNHIAIIHQGMQAGVNLQQYRTLVFASLDWKGQRLLEPVDIEQFIGRIHRTGQVKNCRIITILKTYFSSGEQYDPEFLKWYYEILSDPEGLDLYGDNTPDIAFLQPVIVNDLRYWFVKESKLNEKDKAKVRKESFAKLLLRCYKDEQKKEEVKERIQTLCQKDGFGKQVTSEE